jgi:hypothetical protein
MSQVLGATSLDLSAVVDTAARFVTTEYASLTAAGAPITWPVTPYRGEDGNTLDVSTGLTYPLKAERARRNRRVALSFTFPAGSGVEPAPIIAVQGLATVRDRDLAATSSRYLKVCSERFPEANDTVPNWIMRRLDWYWTRMWVEVTPTRVLWWEGGDLSRAPREWLAPDGTDAPPSDPPPDGRGAGSWSPARTDWQDRTSGVLDRLGLPVLTVVDGSGFPLPVKVRAARRTADGFAVVPPVGADVRPGPAFLSFHTHAEVFDGQENVGLAGTASIGTTPSGEAEVLFRVERALADFGVARSKVGSAVQMVRAGRRLRPRLQAEAARRGATVPRYDELTR